jgi:hypothetical protein
MPVGFHHLIVRLVLLSRLVLLGSRRFIRQLELTIRLWSPTGRITMTRRPLSRLGELPPRSATLTPTGYIGSIKLSPRPALAHLVAFMAPAGLVVGVRVALWSPTGRITMTRRPLSRLGELPPRSATLTPTTSPALQGGRGLLIVAMPVGFHHLIVRLVLLSRLVLLGSSKARGAQ